MSLAQTYLAQMMKMEGDKKKSNEELYQTEIARIREQAAAAKDMSKTLLKMRNLNRYGNMEQGMLSSVLQKFGIDFPSLFSADSQVFEKLSHDMTKNAKAFFGTRLSESMINIFLKTVPTRSMTKGGREIVIDTLLETLKPAQQERNEMMRIWKENGERIPDNFMLKIEEAKERYESAMDKKLARFVGGEDLDEIEKEKDGSDIPYDAGTFGDGYVLVDKNLRTPKGRQGFLRSQKGKWVPISEEDALRGLEETPEEKRPNQEEIPQEEMV